MSNHHEKPQLLTWLTCDGIHLDPMTGKQTLLGIFSSLRAHSFPVVHARMFWFLTVTNVAVGEHELKIHLGLPFEGERRLVVERRFRAKSPVQRINLINEIKNMEFKRAGDYSIEIEIDDEVLLVTNFNVSN